MKTRAPAPPSSATILDRCVGLVYMTKDEAIHRILIAISELQDYSASQGPLERTSADEAITMLEDVIESLQKRQMEYPSFAG